jgi:hypothetical protein
MSSPDLAPTAHNHVPLDDQVEELSISGSLFEFWYDLDLVLMTSAQLILGWIFGIAWSTFYKQESKAYVRCEIVMLPEIRHLGGSQRKKIAIKQVESLGTLNRKW